jgi:hypothetical protein
MKSNRLLVNKLKGAKLKGRNYITKTLKGTIIFEVAGAAAKIVRVNYQILVLSIP